MNAGETPTPRRVLAASLAYGVATFFAFPHPVPGSAWVVDLGLAASPLAFACLLFATEGLARRRAIRVAFLASLVAHACIFHWFYVVTVVHGGVHPALGVFTPFVPSLYVSCFTALFVAGWTTLRQKGRASPILAAALFTAVEYVRGVALGGFPWASLGYGQWRNAGLLGLTSITGVHGLVFAVALAGAVLAALAADRRMTRHSAVAIIVVVALHGFGVGLGTQAVDSTAERIRVAALQGNVDQAQKWSEARVGENLGRYLALSRRAVAAGAEIVVWPESAVPSVIELDVTVREPIAALARETQTAFVLGATGAIWDPVAQTFDAIYDSAFVMDGRGRLLDRYDKTHLVPFGEFVPFRALLGFFLEALARGLANLDVTSGQEPRALDVPVAGRAEPVRVGVPICYELIFPDLVRRMPADGAQMLLGITNDAWYGRTGARYQFLAMTAVRAAETARPMVRVANSGVSAIIDARGRILQRSVLDVQDVLVGDIPLLPEGDEQTFYVRYGDVFAWACAGGAVAMLLRRRRDETS